MKRLGMTAVVVATEPRRVRRQRLAAAVHRLGERAVFELLDELARRHPEIADDLDRRLAAHAERLNRGLLRAVCSDRFAPAPMRPVSRDV